MLATVQIAIWFTGCKTTTVTTIEPIKRLETSPYFETLMRQLAIEGGQRKFTILVDTSAHELMDSLFQK